MQVPERSGRARQPSGPSAAPRAKLGRRARAASLTLIAASLCFASCGEEPTDAVNVHLAGTMDQGVSLSLLQQRSDAIKAVHAAHPSIHNPFLFAGIAYTESQMAHCYSEYYNQVSVLVCPGPSSSDCGGPVTAGYWDGACANQAGGLGMWQFDEGSYTQTLSKWTSTGYWNGQPRDILDVEGSIAAAIDFILFKAWYSSYTPYFSSTQAMYDWINSIRPIDGNADWELWLGFLANSYNGHAWGSAGWASVKEDYRSASTYVYNALGGNTYWYGSPTSGFSNLSATLGCSATFNFAYSGSASSYIVDLSLTPDMSSGVYLSFGSGAASPIVVSNPKKWGSYTYGRTLYWRVLDANRSVSSPVQTATVTCPDSAFSNLSATLGCSATFNFAYSGSTSSYIVDLSLTADMSSGVYLSFGTGTASPVVVSNPKKWGSYTYGRTLYWRVLDAARTASSATKSAVVSCP